ncbi:hypothetical protein ACLMJK_003002 [Lecanora helva]
MIRQSFSQGPITVLRGNNDRPKSKEGEEKSMWSSMLNSVASGKKLPEKNLLVLGGTPELQKEFLEIAASDTPRRFQDRHKKRPVVANAFALGYTYHDVLDADQEARLSIYLLPEPSPSFAPLLKPLFTTSSIPESLLVFLLDWSEPWHWIRQVRDWIMLLQRATSALDDETKNVMQEIMEEWQQRKRGVSSYDTGNSSTTNESNVTLPLSQGEWDEPLGLPLCVVCHGADRIDDLERDQNWNEEEFDYVLQFLRTILMKHGASLVYTSNSVPNSLPTLLHTTLGIHSLLKKQTLKHNVVDRDKVLVPPNWDSWGKIRVLREGFDVEAISNGWSIDIRSSPHSIETAEEGTERAETTKPNGQVPNASFEGAVLPNYESTIHDPQRHKFNTTSDSKPHMEVPVQPHQDFLAAQLETISQLQAEEEKAVASKTPPSTNNPSTFTTKHPNERVNEHIGPVQVNMGGIQVDADDMLKRLRNREKDNKLSGSKTPEPSLDSVAAAAAQTLDEQKIENERLSSFFANLAKRGVNGSPRNTPGREGRGAATGSGSVGKETPSKKKFVKIAQL